MSINLAEEVTMEGNSLHIIEAKTGSLVPVLNDHNLHSTLDPIKDETENISAHSSSIQNSKNILVLGLGFGYHVEAIKKINPNARIWIVEPNRELINLYIKNIDNPIDATLLCEDVSSLYNNNRFVELLLSKPYIYSHKKSIEANPKYFRSFLNYQASSFCSDYIENTDFEIRGYLENEIAHNQDITLHSLIQSKKNVKTLSAHDHLILALDSLIESNR